MKNKFLQTITFFMFTFSFLSAQSSDTPKMLYWIGGKFNIKLNGGMNSSVGIGSGNGVFGGMISPNLNSGSTSIFSNPAELAYLKKSNIFFETKLGVGISDLLSQSDMTKQTTDMLKDTATFIFTPGTYRKDMEIGDQEIAQTGGLTALTGAIPFENYFVLCGGFSTPVDFSSDLLINGISTDLASSKMVAENETKIDIILKPTILAITRLKVNRVSYGLAKEVMNNANGQVAVGFTINRYDVRNFINLDVDFQGMVVLNNLNEYYFNDPNDPSIDPAKNESNNLYFRAKGDYKDTRVGFTLGANYNPANKNNWLSRFNFSMVYNYNPDFVLSDKSALMESYQPRFMVGRFSGKDADKFDVAIDSMDLAKPNLTKPTQNYFADEVLIKMPSSLTLGVDAKFGNHNVSLNILKYFNELSYQFDKFKIGKNMNTGIRAGADFQFPDELKGWAWALLPIRFLYLDLDGLIMQLFKKYTQYENPHYRFYGGMNFGNAIVEGFEDKDMTKSLKDMFDLPIPAEIGYSRQYTIMKNINVGVFVFGFPDLFLRFSLGYNI
ncbi:MAG: hypothetical protein M0Q21_11875 [Ignavibacteriaceae bacterium]|nr:hypothetical protein [Ignavibacteriaceae bacterium]